MKYLKLLFVFLLLVAMIVLPFMAGLYFPSEKLIKILVNICCVGAVVSAIIVILALILKRKGLGKNE